MTMSEPQLGPTLVERDAPPLACHALEVAGVHPLLARLFVGRGVRSMDELGDDAARLLPPATLKGAHAAFDPQGARVTPAVEGARLAGPLRECERR